MTNTTEQPIRPRTKDERRAYEAGYAAAVVDVATHGLHFASDQVRLMMETAQAFDGGRIQ